MKNSLSLFLSICLCIIVFSAKGQKRIEKIVSSGELRVGISGSQPPFSMKDRNGNFIGFDIELANLLATSMELEVKFVQLPFEKLLEALEGEQVDMVISGMTITPERNLKTAFVGPYLISGKSILTKSKVLSNATNPGDINTELKVVTLKGSTSQRFVEEYLTNANIILEENYDLAIDMIRKDEADVMVADYPTCAFAMLKYPDEEMVILDQPLTIEPIGIALPSDDALFINLVDNYIESLEMHGVLELMEEKWFSNPMWLLQLK